MLARCHPAQKYLCTCIRGAVKHLHFHFHFHFDSRFVTFRSESVAVCWRLKGRQAPRKQVHMPFSISKVSLCGTGGIVAQWNNHKEVAMCDMFPSCSCNFGHTNVEMWYLGSLARGFTVLGQYNMANRVTVWNFFLRQQGHSLPGRKHLLTGQMQCE